jgi:bifunctional non-homologous end joining protein LigD
VAQAHPSQAPGAAAGHAASGTSSPAATTAVTLTHPERILYPDAGISKGELADYFTAVAAWLLPDLIGRPLSLVRCPDGVGAGCFYQKHAHDLPQEGLARVPVREENGRQQQYVAVVSFEGVLNLLQAGVIELHTWGSHATALARPDRLVFDLDPHEGLAFTEVIRAAQEVRARLADLGLDSFVKTTGGKGLHVVAPLLPEQDWEAAKAFSRALAGQMATSAPGRYVVQSSKAQREGRIFIDYLRNTRGATVITPYGARARPQATVATPLAWEELDDHGLRPQQFTVRTVPARLQEWPRDPWAAYFTTQQALTADRLAAVGVAVP